MILRALVALILLSAPLRAETDVKVVTSPGGITAWLVEEPAIPMIALEIVFEGGAARDPAGKAGVANFLSGMLDEGAGDLDSQAFAKRAEELAVSFSADVGRDSFTISSRMLTENRDDSLALLKLALTAPRFDAEPLERIRKQIESSLRSDETDAGAIAGRAIRSALFPDDPYGQPTDGTLQTVAAITAEDLRGARARLLNRSKISIGVVGDITATELGPILDDLLLDLPADPWTRRDPVQMAEDRSLIVLDLDSPQSSVTMIQEGIAREDPDFIAAYVMNHILGGGGFGSRLTTEVREKRGLTYGIYSYIAPFKRTAMMVASVSSDNAKVAEAIEVVKAEWGKMAEGGVTAKELDEAKRYLTGAYPLRFDSNGKIAGNLAGLMRQGFTPEYMRDRNGLIEAVTREDIARVARRLLKAERLKVVVVGRPEGL